MFGFWKKKGGEIPEEQLWQKSAEQRARERQEAGAVPQALRALGQEFLPEELEVLAVTGATPFSGSQGEEGDGTRLLLLDLPEPGFDPDLKAILDEQKKPVTFWAEGLGTFALNRALGWFEAEADWLGSPIRLDLDRDEDREKCLSHLRALMAGQANWDGRLRDCAARDLLELANDWASDGGCEEREPEEITRGQFMERLEPDAVQISGDGSFDFWFNDGALFWGHSIHVTGSLEGGPEKAEMEG